MVIKMKGLKFDFIFAPMMLVVGILLFLLKATGLTAHIAVSVVGVAILIVYAVLTKKEWKIPALEIAMRVMYGLALITGIVIMNVSGGALAIIHRIFAVLFLLLLVVLFVQKLIVSKKA